jgi:glycosyltransferase involved in cell wall biosynthesis
MTICVIPAWNESRNIGKVIAAIKPFFDKIIVVDDGSGDNTAEIAENSGATVLRHIMNRGQGAALRTGTDFALTLGADIIVHFDADGQFSGGDIPAMLTPLKNEADIVFGSRFLGKKSAMPLIKSAIAMPLARLINRVFLDVRTTDPQCGFRAFTRLAASRIRWRQDDMAHCSEILSAASRSGLRLAEVPITVSYTRFGSGLGRGLKILKDLFLGSLID